VDGHPLHPVIGRPIIRQTRQSPFGDAGPWRHRRLQRVLRDAGQDAVAAGEPNAYLRLGWNSMGLDGVERHDAHVRNQLCGGTSDRSSGDAFRCPREIPIRLESDAEAFTTQSYNVALAYPGNATSTSSVLMP